MSRSRKKPRPSGKWNEPANPSLTESEWRWVLTLVNERLDEETTSEEFAALSTLRTKVTYRVRW